MVLRALAAIVALASGAPSAVQEPAPEAELVSAIKAGAEKGFTYVIKPVADIPNFNAAREELAGATVKGEYSGTTFHAQDGMFEIYRRGDKTAVKTETGWLPLEKYVAPLRLAIREAFEGDDGRRWRKGNVTKGREALETVIRLSHLVHRADIHRLTNLAGLFTAVKRAGAPEIGGKPSALFEGDMTETAAFNLLQGPFEELVKRGVLSFENASGVARIWVQDGAVRRIHGRVGGKYSFYHEDDNVQRKGYCTIDITAELTKTGETTVTPPAEAAALLN